MTDGISRAITGHESLVTEEGEITGHKLERPRANKTSLYKSAIFSSIPHWNHLPGARLAESTASTFRGAFETHPQCIATQPISVLPRTGTWRSLLKIKINNEIHNIYILLSFFPWCPTRAINGVPLRIWPAFYLYIFVFIPCGVINTVVQQELPV